MVHALSFLIIIIMAPHKRRESSFYGSINSISNVDMLPVWEVERLIPKRESATVT